MATLTTRKSAHLVEQRDYLIRLAAIQRTTLAQNIEPWHMPLARVDQGLTALQTFKRKPAWVVGGVVLVTVFRFHRVVKWLRGGWGAWQMLRGLPKK